MVLMGPPARFDAIIRLCWCHQDTASPTSDTIIEGAGSLVDGAAFFRPADIMFSVLIGTGGGLGPESPCASLGVSPCVGLCAATRLWNEPLNPSRCHGLQSPTVELIDVLATSQFNVHQP